MEEKITQVFNAVKMPEGCSARIEGRMKDRISAAHKGIWTADQPVTEFHHGWLTRIAAAACLLAVVVLGGVFLMRQPGDTPLAANVETQATELEADYDGLEEQLQELKETLDEKTKQMQEELMLPGQEKNPGFAVENQLQYGTLCYTEGNITYTISKGGAESSAWYDTEQHSPFTEYADGRVWFIANGEKMDITDQFSEEEPFTYIFTDSYYIVHYIAIGGTPEHMGYMEMLHKSWEPGIEGGLGGFGVNTWNEEKAERYGWETRAKDIFNEYGVHWAS